jgi:hypothetical protein
MVLERVGLSGPSRIISCLHLRFARAGEASKEVRLSYSSRLVLLDCAGDCAGDCLVTYQPQKSKHGPNML